jgi:hypothetical protein
MKHISFSYNKSFNNLSNSVNRVLSDEYRHTYWNKSYNEAEVIKLLYLIFNTNDLIHEIIEPSYQENSR